MPFTPGIRIDGYEVLGLLGAGGMGEVYRVRDSILKRDVALKVLPLSEVNDPVRLQRFEQEAQAIASLNHPNILVIYRFGSYEGISYLASELLEGVTLRQQLERRPIAVEKAIEISLQIARGLAAAHDNGVIHRDLKPENLFITKDGRIKILDFGLAKLTARQIPADGTTMSKGTDPGIVMGTVGYMSPEQIRGTAVDRRSDIFAFGIILYEMLTGQRAFQRSTAAETMTAILNEEPSNISQIAPTTPPGLQRIVKRCLEKNPEQRFQSASDLAFALEALSDSGSAVVSSSAVPRQATRRHGRLALSILCAAVLALVACFLLIRRSKTPDLHVTEYSQLTHSGDAGAVAATDGVNIYLSSGIRGAGIVAATGGEIEKVTKLPPRSYLLDLSPDGTTLLYLVYQSQVAATAPLYSLKVLGGSPRRVGSASSAQWSPDGNSIWYDSNGGISHMNADGTNSHKLISAGGPIESFAVSPDGTRIRYFKNGTLWEADSSGKNLHQLLRGWNSARPGCCGAWSPDGSKFIFGDRPKYQLWALDERNTLFHKPTGKPSQLTSSPIRWQNPIFSKDGTRIFCTGRTSHGELIRFDAKTKQFQPFLGGISANLLSFSRDGQTVAYIAYPDRSVWKSKVDGTERLQLSDPSLTAEYLSISPDGSQVAFMAPSPSSNVRRSYVVSSQGGGARLLFPKGVGPETDPIWSPDGRRIAFATNAVEDKTSPSEIRILDLGTHQVSTVPGSTDKFSPRWSPDGQYLLASSLNIGSLFVFDFKKNHWTQIYEGISAYPTWSHDSRFIYTFRYAGDPAVLRLPAKGGAPELIADVKNIRFTGIFGVWLGLDPTDAPLLLRNEGTSDVYALSLQDH